MDQKSRLPIVLAVVAIAGAALGAIVRAQPNKKPAARSRVEIARASQEKDGFATPVTITERKPLAYYTGSVRSDLFTAPLRPAPKPVVKKVEAKKPAPPPPIPPVIPQPFADYVYTGTVNMGGKLMALVENVKTKEGQYLKVGDPFIGGSVSQIDERTLTIDVAGTPNRLAKMDNYKLTPFDKDAPNEPGAAGATPPGGPAPGGPGGPPPPPGAPAPGGPGPMRAVHRAAIKSLPAIQAPGAVNMDAVKLMAKP